jgi:hypothetical protein
MKNTRTLTLLMAGLLLVAVLLVFVSPTCDIPETTMRAKSLAQLVLLALVALATLPIRNAAPVILGQVIRDDCAPQPPPSTGSILPLLC